MSNYALLRHSQSHVKHQYTTGELGTKCHIYWLANLLLIERIKWRSCMQLHGWTELNKLVMTFIGGKFSVERITGVSCKRKVLELQGGGTKSVEKECMQSQGVSTA